MPFHTPGNLPDPGIETVSLSFSALTGGFLTTSALEKPTSIFFRWYYFFMSVTCSQAYTVTSAVTIYSSG